MFWSKSLNSIARECYCLLKLLISFLVFGFLKATYIVSAQLLFLFKELNYLNFYSLILECQRYLLGVLWN